MNTPRNNWLSALPPILATIGLLTWAMLSGCSPAHVGVEQDSSIPAWTSYQGACYAAGEAVDYDEAVMACSDQGYELSGCEGDTSGLCLTLSNGEPVWSRSIKGDTCAAITVDGEQEVACRSTARYVCVSYTHCPDDPLS